MAPLRTSAQDLRLEPEVFTDRASCQRVLAEFAWFCDNYEGEMWERLYGATYWELTADRGTPAYRHDLDGDGTEDVIVKVNWGYCDLGGRDESCVHKFLYGDQPATEGPHAYSISARGAPILVRQDGVDGLIFEGNPSWFHPLEEIRTRTLQAPVFGRLGDMR